MRIATAVRILALVAAAPLMGADGCDDGSGPEGAGAAPMVLQAAEAWTPWSEPVPIAELNTDGADGNIYLTKNELTIYFNSNRTGTLGGNDLWIAHRPSQSDAWGTPVNLGSVLNTSSDDQGPSLSKDERLLFFLSNRTGGFGGADIYVTRRDDVDDDFGWGPPEILGADVNTSIGENAPHFQEKGEDGKPSLYFARGAPANDIFVAPLSKDGVPLGPAVAMTILNSASLDGGPCVRRDGLELIFNSNRAGGFGAFDLYSSTRASVQDAWSTPVNLGAPPNSTGSTVGDFSPALSYDGRTLFFTRALGQGDFNLFMSTRSPLE